MAEEVQEEKKELKAKPVSLIGQIVAAVWIAGFSSFYLIKNVETINIWDIVISGFAIAACFTPVYFNLIMDKIRDMRIGGKQ